MEQLRQTLVLLFCAFSCNMLAQTTLRVPSVFATIQSALDTAAASDIILVAPGTYYENLIWPQQDSLTLRSEEGSASTILDGSEAASVISIRSQNNVWTRYKDITNHTLIEGFTIQNGLVADGDGGGIYGINASPILNDLVVRNNRTGGNYPKGAGMYLAKYEGQITNCSFLNNSTFSGGTGAGAYIIMADDLVIEDCDFSNNTIDSDSQGVESCGAGLCIDGHSDIFPGNIPTLEILNTLFYNNRITTPFRGSGAGLGLSDWTSSRNFNVLIDNCHFEENHIDSDEPDSEGGGMHCYSYELVLTNSAFINNSAGFGGGVHIDGETNNTITNSVFRGNKRLWPASNSGAVSLRSQKDSTFTTFTNCVFSENDGPAIGFYKWDSHSIELNNCTFFQNDESVRGNRLNMSATNCIFWNKYFPEFQASIGEYRDLKLSHCIMPDSIVEGENLLYLDPELESTFLPIPSRTSPCIGAGIDLPEVTYDVESNDRPLPAGSSPDIGAYEVDQSQVVATNQLDFDTKAEDLIVTNPISERLNFAEAIDLLLVYDLNGMLVSRAQNILELETMHFPSGIYIIKMTKNNEAFVTSVIVQH